MARCYVYRDREEEIRRTLYHNLGKTCTIYTTFGGGPDGDGFTGILSQVDDDTCKLISCHFTARGYEGRRNRRRGYDYGSLCQGREHFGAVQTIPLDKITCVTTVQF